MTRQNIIATSLPSLMLVVVALSILYVAWTLFTQAQMTLDAATAQVESFDISEDELADGIVTTLELRQIREDVEAAESRALDYLGIFEALGSALTLGGILVATIGALAASFGLRNYNEIVKELDETRKNYEEILERVDENERESYDTLNSLNSSREDIKRELEAGLRQDWEKSHLALSLLPLAERQYQLGNIDGALETYERTLKLDRTNPVPYYYKGYILTQKEQLEAAVEALEAALTLDRDFYHAQAALGYAKRRIAEKTTDLDRKQQLYKEAESALRIALANDGRLVDADGESWYGSLAGLYKRIGETKKAQTHYELAQEVTPLSSYPAVNLAILALETKAADVNKRFEVVEKLARLKIGAVLENYWGYGDLLLAELALGKNDEARATLETLIEVIPPGVKDVFTRVRPSIARLYQAGTYPDDRRNMDVIKSILDRIDEVTTIV